MDGDRPSSQLRAAPRVEALILAAASYYVTGDATWAGIALDAARDTATETSCRFGKLGKLLHGALRAAVAPERIRQAIAGIDTTAPTNSD